MAKKLTVLQMVQLILNSMDSDEVEAITETIEANQVADIIGETYEEIIDRREWEFLKHRVRQLDAVTGITILAIPSDVMHVECVRYKDHDTNKMKDVRYLPPHEFLKNQQGLDTSQSNVDSLTVNDGVAIGVYNDRVPGTWTSFDEENIVFDAYDSGTEPSGLNESNSTILAQVAPVWTKSDSFVADLPARMFTYFLHEAKSACWLQVKQEANPKAEQIARRQYIKLRELERRAVQDKDEVNYGR